MQAFANDVKDVAELLGLSYGILEDENGDEDFSRLELNVYGPRNVISGFPRYLDESLSEIVEVSEFAEFALKCYLLGRFSASQDYENGESYVDEFLKIVSDPNFDPLDDRFSKK